MSDKLLLELAAKAAGLRGYARIIQPAGRLSFCAGNMEWNPLIDDGDEARLEAFLQMHVEWHPATRDVQVGTAEVHATEPYGKDRQAARRRAGVRAAALAAAPSPGSGT